MIFMLHSRVLDGQAVNLPQWRSQHRDYMLSGVVRILSAGPTLSDDGAEIIGSVCVFEAPSRNAAEEFYSQDPYVMAGLLGKTVLEVFDKRI